MNFYLTSSNQIEINEVKPFQTEEAEKDFFDKSNIVSVDEYREGKSKVSPLEGRRVGSRTGLEEKPNFLSGRFPKFIERGLPYPEPGKLVFFGFSSGNFFLEFYLAKMFFFFWRLTKWKIFWRF